MTRIYPLRHPVRRRHGGRLAGRAALAAQDERERVTLLAGQRGRLSDQSGDVGSQAGVPVAFGVTVVVVVVALLKLAAGGRGRAGTGWPRAGSLDAPPAARPVWHCSMRAAPEDKMLSDDEWAQIAADVMHRTGLAPYGAEDDAVRWVAVRHGDDHIHLVAMLARQDFRRPRLRNDRYRVRDACIAAEQRYGLRSTAPADRTAPRCPTRAEAEKAARRHLDEPPRVTLRRHVTTAAASAGSEQEFFARLDRAGVLARKRYSARNPGQVTGYAVALPGDTGKDGGPVWYGGGELAADLTWPKLRQRSTRPGAAPGDRFTAAERNTIWEHAARVTADAATQIRQLSGPTRRPPPMPPWPRPTHCTQPPPRSTAASCARPPTPTTGPPAHPTAASRHPARPGTSYAPPPA
jgi:hypothetical protein